MMKGLPGGSFNGGRALGFGLDMLIAVGSMGSSLAGKESLVKSLSKIAPELTEAQSKAIIKSALKFMKESEIEDLIAKGNLDSILSKLPKSKAFKILNPELASKIDSLIRKQSFDAFSQVGIVYKDSLEIAIKENMKLKGRIEELLKVKGFENGLNKLTDADLEALIKRLSELDKDEFNDAIKALEAGGRTNINEVNKVLDGASNIYTGGRNQVELDDLARDPSHAGRIEEQGIKEREVGLALEERGDLGKIIRDMQIDKGAEFIDTITGLKWDIKSFESYPSGDNGIPITNPKRGAFTIETGMKKIQKEFKNGNNVIIDVRKLVPEHIEALKKAIDKAGIADRIIWYP